MKNTSNNDDKFAWRQQEKDANGVILRAFQQHKVSEESGLIACLTVALSQLLIRKVPREEAFKLLNDMWNALFELKMGHDDKR